ncbi:hypothetical protein COR50_06160 [Chitinophaga caeni]|uniref:Uncharacterized protein n=1 Tax=Chitinophaga caeni TaxID=2029983 RepID=A0A291QSE6_9BACT|nr:hypothetical protein [Chitinophaga caeni]ATL46793.1 hypothetical protein COR50_06160 [Chitinophaga caeni]
MVQKKRLNKNLLQEAHSFMLLIPKIFRDSICEECGWSEATFYRRAKNPAGFSNAESEKIIEVITLVLKKSIAKAQRTFRP